MFENLRNQLAFRLARTIGTRNLFNDSFLSQIGGGYTAYDSKQSTYLQKGYGSNPDVYAVIKQQADKHASIPWVIKKINDKESKTKIDRLMMSTKGILTPQQQLGKILLEKKAFHEKEMDFPLDRPNPMQTWHEFKEIEKIFLKCSGNIFYYKRSPIEGPNKGKVRELYILPSHLIQIVVKSDSDYLDSETPISHYVLIEGNKFIRFEAEEVYHVKYGNPFFDMNGSHLYGLSPLRAALKNIQSSNEALSNNIKTLTNGGAFGFLHSKGQSALTETQASEIKTRLSEMDASPERLAKIAGVSAEIGFTRISLTTDELKPFEYLKYDQKSICNVLNWSDKLMNNDDGAKYENTKQFRRQVVSDNIMPDNNLINQAHQENFINMFSGYEGCVLESVYDQLPEMQEDMNNLIKWIKEAVDTGLISRNEGRMGMRYIQSSDKDMDVITVKDDVIPLSEALTNDLRLTGM
jgi:phage portal protein BeeE